MCGCHYQIVFQSILEGKFSYEVRHLLCKIALLHFYAKILSGCCVLKSDAFNCYCRILASLYSGTVCIWNYQSQVWECNDEKYDLGN